MAYVNRELAISEMEQVKKEHSFLPQICIKAIDVAINAFKIVPTADVEEVVRCRKCKHGDVSTISKSRDGQEEIACYCTLKKAVTDLDYYCPCGAKMDGRK